MKKKNMMEKIVLLWITLFTVFGISCVVSFAGTVDYSSSFTEVELSEEDYYISAAEGRILYRSTDGRSGYKDYNNRTIVSAQYSSAINYSSGVAYVADKRYSYDNDSDFFMVRYYKPEKRGASLLDTTYANRAIDLNGNTLFTTEEILNKIIHQAKLGQLDKIIEPDNKYATKEEIRNIEREDIEITIDVFEEDITYVGVNIFGHLDTIGYINKKGGFVILLGKYQSGEGFFDGLARVEDFESNIFYINKTGKVVEKDENSNISYSSSIGNIYSEFGRYGLMDDDGNKITEAIYDRFYLLNESYAVVKLENYYGVINSHGQLVVEAVFNDFDIVGDSFVLFDRFAGYVFNEHAEPIYVVDRNKGFYNGELLLNVKRKPLKKFYTDLAGNVVKDVTECKYLGEDLYLLKYNDKDVFMDKSKIDHHLEKDNDINIYRDYTFKYIDIDGNVVVSSSEYDQMGAVVNNRIVVAKDGKYSFVDIEGNLIYPLIFKYAVNNSIYDGSDSVALLYDDNKTDNFFRSLDSTIHPDYELQEATIDYDGNVICHSSYKGLFNIPRIYEYEDFQVVNENGLKGIKRISTNEMLVTSQYSEIKPIGKGLYQLERDNKIGFYNSKTRKLIEPSYDSAEFYFDYTSIVVGVEEGYQLINQDGRVLTEATLKNISPEYGMNEEKGILNLYLFENKDGVLGIMTDKGEVIIEGGIYLSVRQVYGDNYLFSKKIDGEYLCDYYDGKNNKMLVENISGLPYIKYGNYVANTVEGYKIYNLEGKEIFFKPNVAIKRNKDYIIADQGGNLSEVYDYEGNQYLKDNTFKSLDLIGDTDNLFFKTDDGFGIVNIDGSIVVNQVCDSYEDFKYGAIKFVKDDTGYYMNANGVIIYKSGRYIAMDDFVHGYGRVIEYE